MQPIIMLHYYINCLSFCGRREKTYVNFMAISEPSESFIEKITHRTKFYFSLKNAEDKM